MTHLFSHQLDVRFRDCDPLGHVNNAVYLTYLEQARLFYWRSLWGFGSAAAAALPGVILARAEIDYKRPRSTGRCSRSDSGFAVIGRTTFTYEYEIVDESGDDRRSREDRAGDVRLRGGPPGPHPRRNPSKNDE